MSKTSLAFYYFKLQVQCPPGPDKMDARKLHYGLDSLFSSTDSSFTLPSLIEPVITGLATILRIPANIPGGSI